MLDEWNHGFRERLHELRSAESQSDVLAILFHGLSSLLVALRLRLLRAESLIHALKVGQAQYIMSILGTRFSMGYEISYP